MQDDKKSEVLTLIEKAAAARLSVDALHFSQAAVNAANAKCALHHIESEGGKA